jgi:three-Cys-motif partner protein
MGDLIIGDDGLPAEEVGEWAKVKHDRLRSYIRISSDTRRKFLTGPAKSAAFIDIFCGPGRARIKGSGEWIDGSSLTAWKTSLEVGTPFSEVFVADIDDKRRAANIERLRQLSAPVREIRGPAIEAAAELAGLLNRYGLHFAFIDPFSLGALNFKIIQSLSRLNRMDMLIHISKMDHQRNLEINLQADGSALDHFVPGWQERIDGNRPQQEIRRQIVEYWQELVRGTGKRPSTDWELIKGSRGQHLYWLLLVANHDLAHKFWGVATDCGQKSLF